MTDQAQMQTLLTITEHREEVADALYALADAISRRARIHDRDKLKGKNFRDYVEVSKIGRTHPFGSEAYAEAMKPHKAEGGVVDRHFKANPHHPEFYDIPKVQMNFLDIIEMVCDWRAAARTYGTGRLSESVAYQKQNMDLDACQWWLVDEVIHWIERSHALDMP